MYWKQQLQGVIPVSIDGDQNNADVVGFDQQKLVLSKALNSNITALSTANWYKLLHMVLLGVFKWLISKYTHQKDISVGVSDCEQKLRAEVF